MAERLTVLVTGATGKQGGTLARMLRERGHRIRALTRNPDTPAAHELAERGMEVVPGDFEDRASLERAARGVDAIFAMGTPYESGPEAETRQGINLAEATQAAGIEHLLYTSVGSADQKTGIPHFESKAEVEERIRALGVPYTIIRPVWFMENYLSPWILPGLQEGRLAMAMPANRKLQQVPVEDVGRFAALVLERRDEFLRREIDLASDEISGDQVAEILSRLSGREIEYVEQSLEEVRSWSEDFALMYEWFDEVGYRADIAGLRRSYPEVGWHSFEEWAKQQDWSVITEPVEVAR